MTRLSTPFFVGLTLVTFLALLPSQCSAEKVCIKVTSRINSDRIDRRIVKDKCPPKYTEIFDTSRFPTQTTPTTNSLNTPTPEPVQPTATPTEVPTSAPTYTPTPIPPTPIALADAYGDGSGGELIVSSNRTFRTSNPQFTDVSIQSGVTLVVDSGTVIRCKGTFTNNGTIIVNRGASGGRGRLDNQSGSGLSSPSYRPPHPGVALTSPMQGQTGPDTEEQIQGEGGIGLTIQQARQLLRPGIYGGGGGASGTLDDFEAAWGGGSLVVICKNGIVNNGSIIADSTTYFPSKGINQFGARGGGAGGIVILASKTSVLNSSSASINADGTDGGNGNSASAPGGGGGGGIVHFLAPLVVKEGTVSVQGGAGGTPHSPLTGSIRVAGAGGGACGGNGGRGGWILSGNPANPSAGQDGVDGYFLTSFVDPSSLL
jgi:hypothetical protein